MRWGLGRVPVRKQLKIKGDWGQKKINKRRVCKYKLDARVDVHVNTSNFPLSFISDGKILIVGFTGSNSSPMETK